MWFLALLLTTGCEPALDVGDVEVSPSVLDLRDVGVDGAERQITIENFGAAPLQVLDVDVAVGPGAVVDERTLPVVPPGGAGQVQLAYTPSELDADEAHLLVRTDAGTFRVEVLPAAWVGRPEFVEPVLSLSPVLNEPGTQGTAVLRNRGLAPLQLSSLYVVGDGFSVEPQAKGVLESGEELPVSVAWAGGVDDESVGRLVAVTDGEPGRAVAQLNATGFNPVVAQCSANPSTVVAIHESAVLEGHNSIDTTGRALVRYEWSLVERPFGSTLELPSVPVSQPDIVGFVPDVVGTWGFELVVENVDGLRSEPCRTELQAIPDRELWIELSWTVPGDDLDLHFVRPGASFGSFDGDCHFANCVGRSLDWGPVGPDGNPSLDRDDIQATGPENINADGLEAGTYEIWVHDYDSSVVGGENLATLRVYVGGLLAWEGSQGFVGEDARELLATVQWPEGVVSAP